VFQRTPHWAMNNPNYHKEVNPGTIWTLEHLPYYAQWMRFQVFIVRDGLIARYAGAAYLVYLGISMIRKRRARGNTQTVGQSSQQNFLQGIATEVLNPKTALFFLSFIPQFVSPAKGHLILQFLILGAISVVLNTTVDLVVVGFAGLIAQRLARNPKLIERQRTGGVGMIGLGVYVAVSK